MSTKASNVYLITIKKNARVTNLRTGEVSLWPYNTQEVAMKTLEGTYSFVAYGGVAASVNREDIEVYDD